MEEYEHIRERLRAAPCWIFDLDGTLTVPVHDFEGLRRRLGIQPGAPILEAIQNAPPDEAIRLSHEVDLWEQSLADQTQASPGSQALLEFLTTRGIPFGILTRNRRDTAFKTLESIGLLHFFEARFILGRDEAAPKPNPAGIQLLLAQWSLSEGVMVGDYIHDLDAGKQAGCATVHLGPPPPLSWSPSIDLSVRSCDEILSILSAEL